jgi:hypothetical protein
MCESEPPCHSGDIQNPFDVKVKYLILVGDLFLENGSRLKACRDDSGEENGSRLKGIAGMTRWGVMPG